MNIFEQIGTFYHQKTFNDNWSKKCGNGNKKLDEIQVFLKFLKNKNECIENIVFFNQNFKYEEKDVTEPGDLEYLGQKYQITHGKSKNYFDFQKAKNYQIKNQENGLPVGEFIISAYDYPLKDDDRLRLYFEDLKNKEKSVNSDIILIIMYDHRDKPKSNLKTSTKWKDAVFVFEDGNFSVKKSNCMLNLKIIWHYIKIFLKINFKYMIWIPHSFEICKFYKKITPCALLWRKGFLQ